MYPLSIRVKRRIFAALLYILLFALAACTVVRDEERYSTSATNAVVVPSPPEPDIPVVNSPEASDNAEDTGSIEDIEETSEKETENRTQTELGEDGTEATEDIMKDDPPNGLTEETATNETIEETQEEASEEITEDSVGEEEKAEKEEAPEVSTGDMHSDGDLVESTEARESSEAELDSDTAAETETDLPTPNYTADRRSVSTAITMTALLLLAAAYVGHSVSTGKRFPDIDS